MVAGAGDMAFISDQSRTRDVYGRLLGRIEVDGVDVGQAQIAAGLAQAWTGAKGWWCD
jgi:endonuclease YncB( thermonuclease family)